MNIHTALMSSRKGKKVRKGEKGEKGEKRGRNKERWEHGKANSKAAREKVNTPSRNNK